MRSQDALMLLPLDIFIFTLIQEYVAASTGKQLGQYYHTAGSFHYYEEKRAFLDRILAMEPEVAPLLPPMPSGSQKDSLRKTLELEERIRVNAMDHMAEPGRRKYDARRFIDEANNLPDFWKTIVHCLLVMAALRVEDQDAIKRLLDLIHPSMQPYVRRAHALSSANQLLDSYDFFVKA